MISFFREKSYANLYFLSVLEGFAVQLIHSDLIEEGLEIYHKVVDGRLGKKRKKEKKKKRKKERKSNKTKTKIFYDKKL